MALNGSGREALVVSFGREGEVHLAGALSDQFRFLGINSAEQLVEQRARGGADRLQLAFHGQDAFEITSDGIEGQGPGVALVRRGGLQERDDGRLGARRRYSIAPTKAGTWAKFCFLGQETGQLDVGVHAVFQLAIELQEKTVLEKHGGVALLGVEHLRRRRLVVRLLRQQIAFHANQMAIAPFQIGAGRHQAEQFFPKSASQMAS